MSDTNTQRLEFKSELRQVLNIITHSLYSHKEVFLRELISNASDAIDKIRFNSLGNDALLEDNKDWKIKLAADKDAGTLTISDNGIGMSREGTIENLGTIAKSGTKDFLESLKSADAQARPELIGQFGVGFYSAFMVADTVTVITRTAGNALDGVRWISDGQGEFSIEAVEKPSRGTDVILHLKTEEKEFLEEWRLRQMVKQFSDFIEHPVVMDVSREDADKKKTIVEETLNSRKAIWLRSKTEVTPEEYNAFYKQISNDFNDPAKVIHYTGEGTTEFKVLLFIPSHKSFELQFGEAKVGPRLYIRRVLVMDHCEALLPPYLRFVKGVVDCSDLPLNVSREMLQQNPLLEKIQKNLVKSVFKALEELRTASYDAYLTFYKELGSILKEGLSRDWTNREQIADLLLFESINTDPGTFTTLKHYTDAMPAEQKEIYYLTGEQRTQMEHAPVLEIFREKKWNVLLMTDPIDEFILPSLSEYKGKQLKAADKGEFNEPPDESAKRPELQKKMQPLFDALKKYVADLKDIRISTRLKESAACLVSEEGGVGANMERILQKLGQADGTTIGQRILELNPEHPVVLSLYSIFEKDSSDPRIEQFGRLLYDQALIAEGSKLPDPLGFAKRMNDLLVKNAV
ncbi:MAG: molecular chaperone HtpG [Ignavibacteriales bacterium]|nr:molecular chaperone HtpG [Ignavibacteriales bacterium]